MRVIASAASILLLLGAAASAQTLDDLKNDGKNTDNILTYGMGYHQQRYSPLKQINKQTVKRLVPVWSLSLDNNWGEQAQPIVYNGVMYVTNARHTVAIDVAHRQADLEAHRSIGRPRRRAWCAAASPTRARRSTTARSTAPRSTRTWSRSTPKTGKELWKSKVAEWKDGYSLTLAPLIANGVLVIGNLRRRVRRARLHRRLGSRDRQAACGAATPFRRAARRATRPGRRTTTPGRSAAARAWITGSYDPELDLMYLGHRQSGAVGVAVARPATISTPPRCSRCGRRPARSSGTTSSRRTTPTTTTPAGS